MENSKDIASRVERKLNEQTAEFNLLRDRVLAVIGTSLVLLTILFSFMEKMKEPYNVLLAVPISISLISVSLLIYATITNPISRGMNTGLIKDLIESGKSENDFFLHDISYNLDSFNDNAPKLERLRSRLNTGLVAQALVVLVSGLCAYLNNI